MSYNIRYDNPGDAPNNWENRKDFLISQIAWHAPDVVGTQEGLIHQLRDMDAGLGDYAFFGRGRDQVDEAGEHAAIFYRQDRLELLKEGTFWLSLTPDVPSKGWDAALNRVCTYGLFRERQTGREFYVFNTHFDHVGEVARRESVNLILRQMAALNTAGLPQVLCGDLNLEPESAPIRLLASSMADTHTLAGALTYGPAGTFNGFDCTREPTRRIDYIFTGPGDFRVLGNAVLSEFTGTGFPSDHFPVLARLAFAGE
ncbi:endonuclease/exonuclease/phosphatase family protein [Robiginitalea sp. SC105]|nr:endonuclease/exonuclease/phosphatase family protein [Robiginitalea sp. SC105]